MGKCFRKIVTCLFIFVFFAFMAVPVNALSDLETLNKTVKEEKLLLGDKHISWIDNKDNSTEYFYGKEYGTDNYYKITWDGQATQIANPYGTDAQPVLPTLPAAGGITYNTTTGADNASIDITSDKGGAWNVPMDALMQSINDASGSTVSPSSDSASLGADPSTLSGVTVLGELDGEVYFAVSYNSKYYLATSAGSLFYNTPLDGADGTSAVVGYVTAGHGIALIKSSTNALAISFDGKEVASGSDISVSKFGFIGVEYNDTASDGTTQKHTKVLSFEGTTLLAGRTGQLAHYIASTVISDGTSADYLKDGQHIFTVVDPYTSTTCHYKLVITSADSPVKDVENPSTATGSNQLFLTIGILIISVGTIYVAGRKLKRDF